MENTNEKKVRKFNIIDLLIILVVISAIVIVIYKFASRKIVESTSTKEYYITYMMNELPDQVAEHVFVGDPITDSAGKNSLGEVCKVYKDETSHSWSVDSKGTFLMTDKPGFCCLTIVGKLDAVEETNGISVAGAKYFVGYTPTIEAGDVRIYVTITDISEEEPDYSKLDGVSIGEKTK